MSRLIRSGHENNEGVWNAPALPGRPFDHRAAWRPQVSRLSIGSRYVQKRTDRLSIPRGIAEQVRVMSADLARSIFAAKIRNPHLAQILLAIAFSEAIRKRRRRAWRVSS